jgi:diaminopimelate epimerase
MLKFVKMNGAGNDFVMLDNREGTLKLSGEQIARLCDRHRGVGADGVLVVEPAVAGGDFRMRYYNADGGEAEMCGNGARCFARFVNHLAGPMEKVRFETQAGIIGAEFIDGQVRLAMSEPKDLALNQSLSVRLETLSVHSVNTGVPHAIVFVDDLEAVAVHKLGNQIRFHAHFEPKGTNVNFAQKLGPGSIAIRTYERGVEGETLACGTGVCASAIIHHELTGDRAPIKVKVKGGDTLSVGFEKIDVTYRNVTLTGPADFVFEGQLEL